MSHESADSDQAGLEAAAARARELLVGRYNPLQPGDFQSFQRPAIYGGKVGPQERILVVRQWRSLKQ